MKLRVAIPDMVSPSYFPVIAAVELGFFAAEGIDASLALTFPVTRTYADLLEGTVDFVGGAAHAPLYAFKDWRGCKLLCALSQNMYWLLVVRVDLEGSRGDLNALRGLRIGAAPGPADGLRQMLTEADINPDEDLEIEPISAAAGGGVSFGVAAAQALERGEVDGFWANGMAAEVAVRRGTGKVLIDARGGDGPAGSLDYTFPALVTTDRRIEEEPAQVGAAVRAVVAAQRALKIDPSKATLAARPYFPAYETGLIAELIERDAAFYDASIRPPKIHSLNLFARSLGLLSVDDVAYESVVAMQYNAEWSS